jgi:hypothetical protein
MRIGVGRVVVILSCSLYCTVACAGPIAVVGLAILIVAFVVASIAAFVACRFIPNRRWRALVRLLIVVIPYTPVPLMQGDRHVEIMPAYAAAFSRQYLSQIGSPFTHPVLLAEGVVLLLGLSMVMSWIAIDERYRGR